ncbi:helix-hairpin-helix domain-containing protein [Bacillus sp. FJAT-45037]|uniref:helix-hairpin-helix domain-containing protein n=1 Tax=Bacillus sp. FJAT-45037 TaxID=2011007 RepID=UPI000C242C1C|nr:helix-hairpin-helix domain-containing protein [Bacillus sp. FJAT-45037]
MNFEGKNKYMVGVLTLVAISLSVVLILHFSNTDSVESAAMEWTFTTEEDEQDEDEPMTAPQTVTVDVKGAVVAPGVYVLEEERRVHEAIELAGGFLDDAYGDGVNLAAKLHDEMVIFVPTEGELEMAEFTQSIGGEGSSGGDGKISLNQATQAELETLPGIGPAKATAIIQYREEKGRFEQIEDLMDVSGIGQKSFEKFQDLISVK